MTADASSPEPAAALADSLAPLLVGVEQVATLLSVSRRTVWRLVSEGKLIAPIHIGRAARWQYGQLKRWIEQGCPPASSPGKES